MPRRHQGWQRRSHCSARSWRRRGRDRTAWCRRSWTRCCLLILRGWIERSARAESALGWPGALTDTAIGGALAHLHDDPGHAWTVAELGDQVGLSRSAFAQRFTALVGEPPLTYLTWWRMTVAGQLLRESDAPLSAVAQRVGYASEFAFAKAFKREFGIAPGRYRREGGAAA